MGANHPTINLTHSAKYQGQLQDNKPHGQGKITYTTSSNEQFTFQGKFIDGQPHYGEISIQNLHYIGQITERRAEGDGKLVNSKTDTTYEGKFIKGKLIEGVVKKKDQYCCKGQFCKEKSEENNKQDFDEILHGDSSVYENYSTYELWKGNFWKGNITGSGEYAQEKKISYKGQFHGGQFTGEGILTQQQTKVKYIEGNFNNSLPKMIKKLEFENGDCFEGEFKNGLFDGPDSQYYFADGKAYKGSIYHNNFTGQCQITYPGASPVQIYKGEVHEGKFNGLGILQYRNGVIVKGYFCENMKNGPCILVYGDRMFKGLFMMDRLIGHLQQIPKNP